MRPLFLLLSCAGCAAAATAADEVAPANHIVVTATRTPTPLDEVLAPVIVIDREDIERSAAADVTELLRFHAGLDLGRNGGPGQTTAVFIRGADSNHTLVLVDGVRINPGTIGLAALQNIPPGLVERIEVVKGPRSALYGTDAIGGVINVITRRGARDGWSAEVGHGDYATRQASLSGGLATEHVEFDFGVSWLDSDGFPTRTTDDVDRGYENLGASVQLRADVGRSEVALRHWSARGTSEYSDFFLTPVDQDFEDATTALAVAWPVGAAARTELRATRFEDRIEQNQSADFLRTSRNSLDAQLDWRWAPRHALGAGAMFSDERARSARWWRSVIPTTRPPVTPSPGTSSTVTRSPAGRCSTGSPAAASARPMRRTATASAATRTSSRNARATSRWACGTGSPAAMPCRCRPSATTSTS